MEKVIKRIAMLFMVCGLAVSVSSAYELSEMQKNGVEYAKAVVAELEKVKKQGYNNYIGTDGESALIEGKEFLDFAEKMKKSKETRCEYAVSEVRSNDEDSEYRYRYYSWASLTPKDCLSLELFVMKVKDTKRWLNKNGIKHNLP